VSERNYLIPKGSILLVQTVGGERFVCVTFVQDTVVSCDEHYRFPIHLPPLQESSSGEAA
jgi:hypothetical protein